MLYIAAEGKFAVAKSRFQCLQKLTAEDLTQHSDGEKKVWPAWRYPTRPIWRQSTGRDDAVKMRMVQQILAPGVKNAEEPDLRT